MAEIDYQRVETRETWGRNGWVGTPGHRWASWRWTVAWFVAGVFFGSVAVRCFSGLSDTWAHFRAYGSLGTSLPRRLDSADLVVLVVYSAVTSFIFGTAAALHGGALTCRTRRHASLIGFAAGVFTVVACIRGAWLFEWSERWFGAAHQLTDWEAFALSSSCVVLACYAAVWFGAGVKWMVERRRVDGV